MINDNSGSERCKACDRIFRTSFNKHMGQWEDLCWSCRISVVDEPDGDYAHEAELADTEIADSLYSLDEYVSLYDEVGGGFGEAGLFDERGCE